jgi:hypothetical protein
MRPAGRATMRGCRVGDVTMPACAGGGMSELGGMSGVGGVSELGGMNELSGMNELGGVSGWAA